MRGRFNGRPEAFEAEMPQSLKRYLIDKVNGVRSDDHLHMLELRLVAHDLKQFTLRLIVEVRIWLVVCQDRADRARAHVLQSLEIRGVYPQTYTLSKP